MSNCTELVVCGWSGFSFCLFRIFFFANRDKNVEMHIPKRKSFEKYKHCNYVAFATSPALKLIQLILFNAISSTDGWLAKNDCQTWVSRNCLVIFGFLTILERGPGWFLVTLSNHLFCPFLWPISRSTFRVLLWDFIHHSTSDRFTFYACCSEDNSGFQVFWFGLQTSQY